MKAPFSITLRLLIFCTELQEQKWEKYQWLQIVVSDNKHRKTHAFISRSESQGLNMLLCNWETNPVKLQSNAKHIPAVQMNNCLHCVWIWRVAEGECRLHLRQAVEGEEGMSLYLCDAVALGNLTVTQRNGSTSVNRLTRVCKQMTLEISQIQGANFSETNINSNTGACYGFISTLLNVTLF